SEIIKVRTLEGTAIRTRTIIQFEPVNSIAIMIKWQGSSLSYINEILNSFKVRQIYKPDKLNN
ncbi:unnamed protein product, partial [Rotaria sordida]